MNLLLATCLSASICNRVRHTLLISLHVYTLVNYVNLDLKGRCFPISNVPHSIVNKTINLLLYCTVCLLNFKKRSHIPSAKALKMTKLPVIKYSQFSENIFKLIHYFKYFKYNTIRIFIKKYPKMYK